MRLAIDFGRFLFGTIVGIQGTESLPDPSKQVFGNKNGYVETLKETSDDMCAKREFS